MANVPNAVSDRGEDLLRGLGLIFPFGENIPLPLGVTSPEGGSIPFVPFFAARDARRASEAACRRRLVVPRAFVVPDRAEHTITTLC